MLSASFSKTTRLVRVFSTPAGRYDLYDRFCMLSASFSTTYQAPSSSISTPAGRFGLYGWFRMLFVSYFSNLVGALLLVGLMKGGNVFYDGRKDFLIELAQHKVSYPWYQVLCRGEDPWYQVLCRGEDPWAQPVVMYGYP